MHRKGGEDFGPTNKGARGKRKKTRIEWRDVTMSSFSSLICTPDTHNRFKACNNHNTLALQPHPTARSLSELLQRGLCGRHRVAGPVRLDVEGLHHLVVYHGGEAVLCGGVCWLSVNHIYTHLGWWSHTMALQLPPRPGPVHESINRSISLSLSHKSSQLR